MKNNHRYSKAREAGVRTIGCSDTVLADMQRITSIINSRYAGKFSPRNMLDLIINLMPLIFAMAKAMISNSGYDLTISFHETGFGDAKTVRWLNPNLPTDYKNECGQGKGKTPTSTKHASREKAGTMTGSKEAQPKPVHAPSGISQSAPTASNKEPARTEEKPKPPMKEDSTEPLFPEDQVASRKPNGGQNI